MVQQFLKPDWRKIVLATFLMIISLPGYPPYYRGGGIPLPYFTSGKCPIIGPNLPSCAIRFIPVNLVLDIIILYLLSCLIFWIYDKVRKKS
ncbi:hypothetical protein KJA15_01085 [Patescibacteria group bacterium]|nr:hypothetical protein [Patescibacteria group bacterium]